MVSRDDTTVGDECERVALRVWSPRIAGRLSSPASDRTRRCRVAERRAPRCRAPTGGPILDEAVRVDLVAVASRRAELPCLSREPSLSEQEEPG